MIKYVSGDITHTQAEAIAHGVAPNDDFKNGLAFTLREQWPALYKDFRHFCHTQSAKEGDLWTWKGAGGPFIINLFTQEPPKTKDGHPGKASMTNINHCFKSLTKEIEEKGLKKVALTKVATGVGGLEWNDVKPMVEKYFAESDVEVYVYETFKKGVQAEEK